MSSQASYLQAHSVFLYRASNRSNAGKRLWHDLGPLSHSRIWQAYSRLLSSPCMQQQVLLRTCTLGSSRVSDILISSHVNASLHALRCHTLHALCLTCSVMQRTGTSTFAQHLVLTA